MTSQTYTMEYFNKSIQSIASTYLSFKPDVRNNIIYSMYQDEYYYYVCGDGGVILSNIKLAFQKYDEENVSSQNINESNSEINLIGYLKKYLKCDTFISEETFSKKISNPKQDYFLKINMLKTFEDDIKRHSEWVLQGFSCEYDWINTLCKGCGEIYNQYWKTDPCQDCGKIWWSSS